METEIKTIHNILIGRYATGLPLPHTGKKGMLNGSITKGTKKVLEACTVPRLFFLLKGKAFLSGEIREMDLLNKQTFTLLPAGINIHIHALADTRYVLVYCHPFRNINNRDYFERIKGCNTDLYPAFGTLPILGTLGTLLHSSMIYMDDELLHSPLFDALFVLMRTLYTTDELASMFHYTL